MGTSVDGAPGLSVPHRRLGVECPVGSPTLASSAGRDRGGAYFGPLCACCRDACAFANSFALALSSKSGAAGCTAGRDEGDLGHCAEATTSNRQCLVVQREGPVGGDTP